MRALSILSLILSFAAVISAQTRFAVKNAEPPIAPLFADFARMEKLTRAKAAADKVARLPLAAPEAAAKIKNADALESGNAPNYI